LVEINLTVIWAKAYSAKFWSNLVWYGQSQTLAKANSVEYGQIWVRAYSIEFRSRLIRLNFSVEADSIEYGHCSRHTRLNTIKFCTRLIRANTAQLGSEPTPPNFRHGQLNWIRVNFSKIDSAEYCLISVTTGSAEWTITFGTDFAEYCQTLVKAAFANFSSWPFRLNSTEFRSESTRLNMTKFWCRPTRPNMTKFWSWPI